MIDPGARQRQFIEYDFTGRTDKYRCENPRIFHKHLRSEGVILKYKTRCRKCETCLNHRKAVRIARAMNELLCGKRTWMDCRTWEQKNYLRFLADRGDPAALSILEHGFPSPEAEARWNRHAIAEITTNYIKRIRKAGHKIRFSKHWEKHKDGKDHCHLLIHETDQPVMRRQLEIAAYIMPRGYQLPERQPRETNEKYYSRVRNQLLTGWMEWKRLRDDQSEDARQQRMTLPFQTGLAGSVRDKRTGKLKSVTSLCKSGKHAVGYVCKAVSYSAKDGGRWSASHGYGKPFQGFRMKTRDNRNVAMAAMAALWLTVFATNPCAAGPGSTDPHKGAAPFASAQDRSPSGSEWCRVAALVQEVGPKGPLKSPLAPPTTGPPK